MDPSNIDKFFEMLPLFIIFPIVAYIVRISLEYGTRKKMIEKGLVGDEAKNLFRTNIELFLPSSLKWGMVLTFVGLVIIVMKLLPVFISAEVAFGVMLVAAGIAMLAYYFMASSKARENNNKTP